jgi:NAD+ synthetase
VVLCNLWGGNDEILFDGSSLAVNAAGETLAELGSFRDDFAIVSLFDEQTGSFESKCHSSVQPVEELRSALSMGISDYARKTGFASAVMGLSGGIDSAVCACLAVDALGPKNVLGIALPSPFSSEGSVADAKDLANRLGIRLLLAPISKTYETALSAAYKMVGEGPFGIMEENLQARIRGLLLMAVSNRTGALLITTGNKSELAVGYCTLYGDMCGGLAAISDVYKRDVYALGRLYEQRGLLPESSLTKPPSAELRPDQKDQDSLPPYELLDAILERHVDQELGLKGILKDLPEATPELVHRIMSLVAKSEYKRRQAAPGLRVSSKAFGYGRRIPVVANALGALEIPGGS